MLSKNFISLLESMKSPYNEIYEDRDERIERREERRRERREDKFGVSTSSTDGTTTEVEGDSDFKIRPFIRAVEQLKSQVQSEIFNIDQTIKNRESGHQSASTYKTKFNAILEIILKINSKVDLIKDKEGRNLESNDLAEIKIFRGLYTTAANDFLAAQKEWSEKKLDDDTKYLSDLKDTDTNNFIQGANKAFEEAKAMLNDLIRNSQSVVGATGATGATGAADLATGETIKAGKRYTNDSKEGKIVIEVKKTIYTKFKKDLGDTSDWKVVYKSYPNVSGSLLGNTQAVIKGIKAGISGDYPDLKSDKGGDITTAFINAINKVTESKENTSGRLITFANFIKSKVNEGFDKGAAVAAMGVSSSSSSSSSNKSKSKSKSSSSTSSSTSRKVPEYSATPFANDTEGNKFRAWVIKTHADWAKTNSLDATGAKDNRYVRKAYQEFGEEYKKAASVPEAVKEAVLTNSELDTIKKKIEGYGAKAELKFTAADKQPCILFYSGKEYAFLYNTRKVSYTTEKSGFFQKLLGFKAKTFWGMYDSKTNIVKFPGGKAWDLKYVSKFTITEGLIMTKEESAKATKADELLTKMSDMIVAKFSETGFWKPFKGTFNDDEDAASIAFTKWYGAKIEDAYYNPALNRKNQLPASKAKDNLAKNFSDSGGFHLDTLIKKLYGSTSNDTYKWTIYKSDGTTKSYSVDTDF